MSFCLDNLSIDVSGVLKSPTIIILPLISPFMSGVICFKYLGCPMLGASDLWMFYPFLGLTPLSLCNILLVSCNRLSFKVNFVWYEYCYPSFLFLYICMEYLFSIPEGYIFRSEVSWRQYIDRSCFLSIQLPYVLQLEHFIQLHLKWLLIGMYLLPFC